MTKSEIRDIWLAGFHSSGEGWNGEHPFSNSLIGPAIMAMKSEKLEEQFEEWYDTELNNSTG